MKYWIICVMALFLAGISLAQEKMESIVKTPEIDMYFNLPAGKYGNGNVVVETFGKEGKVLQSVITFTIFAGYEDKAQTYAITLNQADTRKFATALHTAQGRMDRFDKYPGSRRKSIIGKVESQGQSIQTVIGDEKLSRFAICWVCDMANIKFWSTVREKAVSAIYDVLLGKKPE